MLNNIDIELENKNNEDEMRKIIKENKDKLRNIQLYLKKLKKNIHIKV